MKAQKLFLENQNGVTLDSSYWLQDNGTGNATTTFNGTGSLHNGGGSGGSGGGVTPDFAAAPEPGSMAAMAMILVTTFGGGIARRFRK